MIIKTAAHLFLGLIIFLPVIAIGGQLAAHEIVYDEKEEDTDFYTVKYTVSDNKIRIDDSDDPGEDESGFIIFDLNKEIIYSVSHFDQTILVIPKYSPSDEIQNAKSDIHYQKSIGAPLVSGKMVFNYTVTSRNKETDEKCLDVQIAEGLWLDVTKKLKQYQTVVSAQQVKTIDSVPAEYKTACYLIDQVFNTGEYYDKGLPLHEWHSNNRVRMLKSFKQVNVKKEFFNLPADYKQFSLEQLKH